MGTTPEQSEPSQAATESKSLPQMRYPDEYVWFVFFSSLDVMLTWAILNRGGHEVNPIANVVIDEWGLPGAIVFKFTLMLMVIGICEVVGGDRDRLARGVARIAIVISSLPVLYSLFLLTVHTVSEME